MSSYQELVDKVNLILPVGDPASNPISGFRAVFNPVTNGATAIFTLAVKRGINTLVLKRNFTKDYGTATVLNTISTLGVADGDLIQYDDNDPELQNQKNVYYWVDCVPLLNKSAVVTVGPVGTAPNLDQQPPSAIVEFDASHAAVSGGSVLVNVSFEAPKEDRFGSCQIEISGYKGVAAFVLIAQNTSSPFSFSLQQTGENVTLRAIAVSKNGVRASTATAPTKALTLGSAATVPAKVIGASATEIAGGVQISFPASGESGITSYQVYRGRRGGGFGAAASIGTVAPTGSSSYSFLDANGLTGLFEWYVFAVSAAGNGAASDAIVQVQAGLTSADSPPNAPANQTNFATVDSIDSGTDATIRIYGTGGVGSSWTYKAGYGPTTIPAGTILHKSYATVYYIVWDTQNQIYIAFTDAPSTLPDNYIWAAKVTTVNAGGTGGTTGGGGTGGGTGGSGINRFDLP